MTTISTCELIYDNDCPNAALTRLRLIEVFSRHPEWPHWQEWERSDPAAPKHVARYGSPTILVDGRDVAGQPPAEAPCCRMYRDPGGPTEGAPSVVAIARALATGKSPSGRRFGALGTIMAVALAALPVAGCPACWPAWLGVLASLGLGFLATTAWQIELLTLAILIMGVMAWRQRNRWRLSFLAMIALGWMASVFGKVQSEPWATWSGTAALALAGILLVWPRASATPCDCP